MNEFREIHLHGNQQAIDIDTRESVGRKGPNVIQCWDGFRFSVLAGPGAYCTPRPESLVGGEYPMSPYMVPGSYPGPYTHVEVGFFNGKLPKPWKAWRPYCDGAWSQRYIVGQTTVFTFVPVSLVYDLIRHHGGEAPVVGEPVYGRARAIRNRRRHLRRMENLLRQIQIGSAFPDGT